MKLLDDGWDGGWRWVSWLGKGFKWLSYITITYPLEQLYVRGFWRGRTMPEICSSLAPVRGDSAFWHSQPAACAALVHAHFDSYAIWVYMGLYWMAVAVILRVIFRKLGRVICSDEPIYSLTLTDVGRTKVGRTDGSD